MPRIPRKSLESSYFHIMVQGIAKDFIFNRKEYKEEYIKFLYKYMDEFNIELFAYCIMDNHAHLLLHIESIEEMSNYMQKINTLYAMYYNKELNNRVGHVFRNRFKSEEITNEIYLANCIKYIHNNPIKAGLVKNPKEYKYSSYKDYFYNKGLTLNKNLRELIDLDYILREDMQEENFIDIEKDIEVIIESARNKVLSQINNDAISIQEKVQIISELKEIYKIPLNKACEILNINERTFRRKKKEMSVLVHVPKTDKRRKNEI